MNVILRERTTGLWLKPCGRWEANSVNARQFATREEAILCSIELRLPNVDVCYIPESVVTKTDACDRLPKKDVPIRSAA
jgi:hypothetical protein